MEDLSLKFENLKEGLRVEDWWGNSGIIAECSDIHNVLLRFDNGGSSLYCLAEDCEDKDPTPIYNCKSSIQEEIKDKYSHKCIKCHLIFRNDIIVYKTRRDIICPNCIKNLKK